MIRDVVREGSEVSCECTELGMSVLNELGASTERQLRLGLVVDGATPEALDRFGRPVERTKARLRTMIGALHKGLGRGCTAQAAGRAHSSQRGRGRPQERTDGSFTCQNHRAPVPIWS